MAYEDRAATISHTALTDSPLARARIPHAMAPTTATAVQMAIRRGVQRPVSAVAVAFMWSSQVSQPTVAVLLIPTPPPHYLLGCGPHRFTFGFRCSESSLSFAVG